MLTFTGISTNVAAKAALKALLDLCFATGAEWSIGGYTNNYTPNPSSVKSDFTMSVVTALLPQQLDEANKPPVKLTLAGDAQAIMPVQVEFTTAGSGGLPETWYGFILFDGANKVYYAKRFPTPFTFTNVGDQLVIEIGWQELLTGLTLGDDTEFMTGL